MLPFFEEIGQKSPKMRHFEAVLGFLGENADYSLTSPSMSPLNFAESLKVSSMIFRLPPVNFGLTFSMMSLPSCLP